MEMGDAGAAWKEYALTGRPDFLNYLHGGDVSWDDLWRFYQENPADAGAVVKLIRLFHLFQCRDFEQSGSILDRDEAAYQALRSWATFAVACQEVLPESLLCESLSDLLANSMVSPLYYEAVFSVYLEASLEHANGVGVPDSPAEPPGSPAEFQAGRLRVRLPDLPLLLNNREDGSSLLPAHQQCYALWDHAYSCALGEELNDWEDEGGEG